MSKLKLGIVLVGETYSSTFMLHWTKYISDVVKKDEIDLSMMTVSLFEVDEKFRTFVSHSDYCLVMNTKCVIQTEVMNDIITGVKKCNGVCVPLLYGNSMSHIDAQKSKDDAAQITVENVKFWQSNNEGEDLMKVYKGSTRCMMIPSKAPLPNDTQQYRNIYDFWSDKNYPVFVLTSVHCVQEYSIIT